MQDSRTCRVSSWLALATLSWLLTGRPAHALPSNKTAFILSQRLNKEGPYLGLVVPNPYELSPLTSANVFKPHPYVPSLDLAGRRFHIGSIQGHKVIVVMCGLSMLNAGITTQQLLDFFDITGVILHGIAGNLNNSLHIGDTTVPAYWAHTGLWNWQKFGDGVHSQLSGESSGDFTRDYGYLHFGNYNTPQGNSTNLLNNVWLQPEEIFPVTSVPEVRQHAFWLPVDDRFLNVSKRLENLQLQSCVNATLCLDVKPKLVVGGLRGASSNVFLDNAAYRDFLHYQYNVSIVDMETAAVALVCKENNIPFIGIRALLDLAGGETGANQFEVFGVVAALNAVIVIKEFFRLLVWP